MTSLACQVSVEQVQLSNSFYTRDIHQHSRD
jgi:hypothetical protein